ncbi:MAG: RecQ family ATP-dependent DNA helicase [Spirochaetaceae bacterium]
MRSPARRSPVSQWHRPHDGLGTRCDATDAVTDSVTQLARTRFGLEYLFPYQRLVVANVLEAAAACGSAVSGVPERDRAGDGRERQLVILPTGSGKSLCFQLPALELPGLTIVVYPLLSLIADQRRRLQELGIGCATLTGRSTEEELRTLGKQLRRQDGRGRNGAGAGPTETGAGKTREIALLLTNPESLQTKRARRLLSGVPVSHLVIDEAHCVAEWGETFRPSYLSLGAQVRALAPRVVTGFTATASQSVLERIDAHLFAGAGYHLVRGNPDRPNIRYAVAVVASKAAALRVLLESGRSGPVVRPAVVFCRTRGRCERTALILRRALSDESIRFYHAGLSKDEKTALEEWFLASPDGVLIATCAYGMGVDKKDIRAVIHRDLPPSVESYLQESGRAGRDGLPSHAVVLATPREAAGPVGTAAGARASRRQGADAAARQIPRATPGHDGRTPAMQLPGAVPAATGPLAAFLRGTRCRRTVLVEALGAEAESCSGCDVCEGSASPESPVARRIATWLTRRRRRYTPATAAAVLAGTARQAPVPWAPQREPVFGLLSDWAFEEIEEALAEVSASERLRVIRRGPWRGRIG